ncbi:MAG: glycosyltransferase family 4 protein [Methanobacteriota archaeon]
MKFQRIRREDYRPSLRVLHAPAEIAGQMSTLVQALREIGQETEGLTYPRDQYRFGGVQEVFPGGEPPLPQKMLRQVQVIRKAVNRFDLFHFHSGFTLLPKNLDPIALKALGKPMVMHFWGSDARLYKIAVAHNPWVRECLSERNDAAKERRLRWLAKWIPVALVADAELREYVADRFERTETIPQALDLRMYSPRPPNPDERRPLVVHLPSNPVLKGSAHVLEATNRLRRRLEFEFVLITGKLHSEALAVLERADIVVDQLLLGAYGVLAVEGMALAKPVVCHLRDDLVHRYPERPPIVTATPKSFEDTLEALLEDGERRQRLGLEGRRYAERNHDAHQIALHLSRLYEDLVGY